MSDPVSQLYILVMCISQAGPEGYWGYHSQADTFGRRAGIYHRHHDNLEIFLELTITKLRNYEPRTLPLNRALYIHTRIMHGRGGEQLVAQQRLYDIIYIRA